MKRPAFEEHWRRRFTQRGQARDDDAGIAGWSTTGLQTRFRAFQRLWQQQPRQAAGRWVDVGCGAGTYSRFLADQALDVIGIDYSQPSVEKARQRSTAVQSWIVGDATRLPLVPACADGVLCFGVLQALSASGPALHELTALLKPGGTLWIDALNAHALPHRLKRLLRRPLNLRYETAASLRQQLTALGMEVQLHWVPILPGRLHKLQPWVERPAFRALLRRCNWVGELFSHSMLLTAQRPVV